MTIPKRLGSIIILLLLMVIHAQSLSVELGAIIDK